MGTRNNLQIYLPRDPQHQHDDIYRLFHDLFSFTRPSSSQPNNNLQDGIVSNEVKSEDVPKCRYEPGSRRYRVGRHVSPEGFTVQLELGAEVQDLLTDHEDGMSEEMESVMKTQFLIHYLQHIGVRPSPGNIDLLNAGLLGPDSHGRLRYKFAWKSKGSVRDQIQITYQHDRCQIVSRSNSSRGYCSRPPGLRSPPSTAPSQLHGSRSTIRTRPRSTSPWKIVREMRSSAVNHHRSRLESIFHQYLESGSRICFQNFFTANRSSGIPSSSIDVDYVDLTGSDPSAHLFNIKGYRGNMRSLLPISAFDITRILHLFISRIPLGEFPGFGPDQIDRLSWICSIPMTLDLLAQLLSLIRWKILEESYSNECEPNATRTRIISRWILLKNQLPSDQYRSIFILPLFLDAIICAVICLTEYQCSAKFMNSNKRKQMYKCIRALVQSTLGPVLQNLSDCPRTQIPNRSNPS